jgi:hypothetical protein
VVLTARLYVQTTSRAQLINLGARKSTVLVCALLSKEP